VKRSDLEDRLDERLRRLPDGLATPPREARLRRAVRRGRARMIARRATAATVMLVLFAGMLTLRAEVLDRERRQDAADPGPSARALARGRWQAMAAAPIVDRGSAAAAWTGKELLVWGGTSFDLRSGRPIPDSKRAGSEGAAYNPATNTWRQLPPAPLEPRTAPAAVWTGTELLVWGGYGAVPSGAGSRAALMTEQLTDGAAYNPTTDTWRQLPPAPVRGGMGPGVWTGRELLFVGDPYRASAGGKLTGAAYDPASNRWRRISTSPAIASGATDPGHLVTDGGRAWTGSRLLVVANHARLGDRQPAGSSSQAAGIPAERVVLAYDPAADRWTRRDLGSGALVDGGGVWTGTELLTASQPVLRADRQCCYALERVPGPGRFDPADGSLRRMSPGPLDTAVSPVLLWTGTALLGFPSAKDGPMGDVVAWDPASDRWHALPSPPHRLTGLAPVAVWTGRQLLLWGGRSGANTTPGLVYTPG
jgi:hypothetical protein